MFAFGSVINDKLMGGSNWGGQPRPQELYSIAPQFWRARTASGDRLKSSSASSSWREYAAE